VSPPNGGIYPVRCYASHKTVLELTDNPGKLRFVSIVTRTGDDGSTALMYGRRVPKHDVHVEAYGAVDELNAALGMARATAAQGFVGETLLSMQQDLVAIMGELATAPEDQGRYASDGYPRLEPKMIQKLDELVVQIERQNVSVKGWATPGATLNSAALDVARTVCRRAERRIAELKAVGQLPDTAVLIYFNRLADVLWLLARWVETPERGAPARTTS